MCTGAASRPGSPLARQAPPLPSTPTTQGSRLGPHAPGKTPRSAFGRSAALTREAGTAWPPSALREKTPHRCVVMSDTHSSVFHSALSAHVAEIGHQMSCIMCRCAGFRDELTVLTCSLQKRLGFQAAATKNLSSQPGQFCDHAKCCSCPKRPPGICAASSFDRTAMSSRAAGLVCTMHMIPVFAAAASVRVLGARR